MNFDYKRFTPKESYVKTHGINYSWKFQCDGC